MILSNNSAHDSWEVIWQTIHGFEVTCIYDTSNPKSQSRLTFNERNSSKVCPQNVSSCRESFNETGETSEINPRDFNVHNSGPTDGKLYEVKPPQIRNFTDKQEFNRYVMHTEEICSSNGIVGTICEIYLFSKRTSNG